MGWSCSGTSIGAGLSRGGTCGGALSSASSGFAASLLAIEWKFRCKRTGNTSGSSKSTRRCEVALCCCPVGQSYAESWGKHISGELEGEMYSTCSIDFSGTKAAQSSVVAMFLLYDIKWRPNHESSRLYHPRLQMKSGRSSYVLSAEFCKGQKSVIAETVAWGAKMQHTTSDSNRVFFYEAQSEIHLCLYFVRLEHSLALAREKLLLPRKCNVLGKLTQ